MGDICKMNDLERFMRSSEGRAHMEKIRQMPAQFSEAELIQFHALKAAFDPACALNPGKGIPLLRNCQEYRSLNAADA